MLNNLENWAREVARENQFKIEKEIYRGFYYKADKIRNIIYAGKYQGRDSILKIYDDPRLSDEPIAQDTFNKTNKSQVLFAPEIYKYQTVSSKKGWLIMERLEGGNFLKSPLSEEERANFLELFLEYRKNFSLEPTRKLILAENLPSHEFHIFRISRWLQLANDKEEEIINVGGKPVLSPKDFFTHYKKSIEIIRKEFSKRRMIWCHGHFKPHEIFVSQNKERCYLTDFAHVHMYPEGYELAFIIWADWMISADWHLPYKEWKEGVFDWLKGTEKIGKIQKLKNFKQLMRASLIERILGSILADVCASDKPREEKEKRLDLLFGLWKELL